MLVTGATGNVGSKVVAELRGRGVPVRAFVRDPGRAGGVLGPGVELAQGDLADPLSICRAMHGIESVFLTSGDGPWKIGHEQNVIDAAATAGVRCVVELSAAGAEVGSPSGFIDWQGQIERYMRASGVPFVILQPCFFMSNLIGDAAAIKATGALVAPAGDSRIAMIDPRDVAAVAAVALTEAEHLGQTYLLTGPEALTYAEIAEHLSAATGRPIAFVHLSDEAARAGMLEAGMPDWLVDSLVTAFAIYRRGGHVQEQPTDAVRRLTGREPRGFAEFARDYADLFR